MSRKFILLALVLVLSACASRPALRILSKAQRKAASGFQRIDRLTVTPAGNPYSVQGDLGVFKLDQLNRSLSEFRKQHQGLFQLSDSTRLELALFQPNLRGGTYVRMKAWVADVPIHGGQVILDVSQKGRITAIESNLPPTVEVLLEPQMNAVTALNEARGAVEYLQRAELQGEPELVLAVDAQGQGLLAWKTRVTYVDSNQLVRTETLLIDATSGNLLSSVPNRKDVFFQNLIRDQTLDGRVITNNGVTTDADAGRLYDNLASAWSYFDRFHGRGAYYFDRNNLIVPQNNAALHFGNNLVNAFWNTDLQGWEFGDGDGIQSNPLGNALDVVVHEYTHAITENTANLIYNAESGALNEAYSDIFAAHAEADDNAFGSGGHNIWQIGESVWTPGTAGDALRYMNNPTQDSYSTDFYPNRIPTIPPCDFTNDFCGVHGNSGIANLAFFLLANGGMHPQSVTTNNVVGIGIRKAAEIFFGALHHRLLPTDGFEQIRYKTAQEAISLFGNGIERGSVCDAWDAVGVPGQNMNECQVPGVPTAAPTNIGFLRFSGQYDWIWWDALPNATQYEVHTSITEGGLFSLTANNTAGQAWATFANHLGMPFYAKVRGCNANGCGPFSSTISIP